MFCFRFVSILLYGALLAGMVFFLSHMFENKINNSLHTNRLFETVYTGRVLLGGVYSKWVIILVQSGRCYIDRTEQNDRTTVYKLLKEIQYDRVFTESKLVSVTTSKIRTTNVNQQKSVEFDVRAALYSVRNFDIKTDRVHCALNVCVSSHSDTTGIINASVPT